MPKKLQCWTKKNNEGNYYTTCDASTKKSIKQIREANKKGVKIEPKKVATPVKKKRIRKKRIRKPKPKSKKPDGRRTFKGIMSVLPKIADNRVMTNATFTPELNHSFFFSPPVEQHGMTRLRYQGKYYLLDDISSILYLETNGRGSAIQELGNFYRFNFDFEYL